MESRLFFEIMDARGPKRGSLYVTTERRRLADLIQMAILFHKEGLLCCLHPSHSEYKTRSAQKLAVLSSISVGSATDILMIMSLRHNEAAWEFMIESSALRIFDDSNFVTIAAEPRQGDAHKQNLLQLSFLKRFVNDITPNLQRKTQNEETELERIALQFTSSARELCVSMFLKCAAVVATLCSFFPQDVAFDQIKILDILDRYTSSSWSSPTRQSQYHRGASHRHATSGWHLVNVMFMIQVQELHFWIQSGNKNSGRPGEDTARNNLLSVEDVKSTAHIFCHRVLVEFFAWIFRLRLTFQEESCSEFLETIRDVGEGMNEKLSKELGCNDVKPIPQDLLASTVAAIDKNSPTMADISYDEMKMIPSLKHTCGDDLNWVFEDILMRGRWENSLAFEKYSTFLNVANATGHREACDEPARLMSPEKTPGFGERGQSALKRSLSSNLDQQLARNWKRARKDSSMQRNTQEWTNSAIIPRSKTSSSARSNYHCDGEVTDASNDRHDKIDSLRRQQCQETKEVAIAVEADETSNAIEKLYELILAWPIFPTLERREDFRKVPGKSLRRNGRPVRHQGPNRTAAQPHNDQNHNGSRASTDGSATLSLRKKLAAPLLTSMEAWAEGHYERYRNDILEDVTLAKGIDEYRRHWKAIIPFEIRASVTDSIESLLPKCRQDPTLSFSADIDFKDFVSGVVEKVSPTRKLLNITCRTTGAILFKKIATEFQGGTLCVGYFTGSENGRPTYTELNLIACRRVSWEDDDITPMGRTETVGEMEMHLIVGRDRIRDIGIWPGNTVHLLHLCHFAPYLRMYKAVEESRALPTYLQDVLFGKSCPAQVTDAQTMEELIDPGCTSYLENLRRSSTNLDNQQLESIRSVLVNLGDGNKRASSFSMVHGPPGTGKTTTILYLIGALMHHSKIGHIGEEQTHVLRNKIPEDGILRCRKKLGGVRILVCAASNKAVDNVLERIHREGIPDGKGGTIRPQAVRIARTGYDHGGLQMYTLNQKALPFDEYLHHVGRKRRSPSSTARRSFFKECIIAFSTLASSGGAQLKNCKIPFDFVIIEEIGQATEPETLIPVVNVSKVSNRCHVMAVGDHKQLPPVALASYTMQSMKNSLHFDFDQQMISIFERIYVNKRASCRMLTSQYRMCRAIAEMNNKIFYEGKLQSPRQESIFDASYNRGWDGESKCFARQTFVDTSLLPDRNEIRMETDGDYRNVEEVNIIDEILHHIKRLSGPSFPELRNQIAVLVPYRSQVDHMRTVLQHFGKYVMNGVSRQGFQILVDSVDSMQGSEKDIVIFGSTRSNLEQKVGFLNKSNRLNVATSRAKKLQVIIGDLSTLEPNKYFSDMKRFCLQDRSDVAFLQLHPTKSSYLLDGLTEYRR